MLATLYSPDLNPIEPRVVIVFVALVLLLLILDHLRLRDSSFGMIVTVISIPLFMLGPLMMDVRHPDAADYTAKFVTLVFSGLLSTRLLQSPFWPLRWVGTVYWIVFGFLVTLIFFAGLLRSFFPDTFGPAPVILPSLALLPFWYLIAGLYRANPRDLPATPTEPRCRRCGYALRGLPERRCPECGADF